MGISQTISASDIITESNGALEAVAFVGHQFDKKWTAPQILHAIGASSENLTTGELREAADLIGFKSQLISLGPKAIQDIPMPALACLGNHWFGLNDITDNQ